jgi:hypothetical protein
MSRMKETIEPESARKSAEGRPEHNGYIGPINKSTEDTIAQLEVDPDLSIEVDDDYLESADPVIQWHREQIDGISTYPTIAPHHRSSGPFDTVSV